MVRRSVPDSGVLIRLKAQMAEVRSKMSNVKSQVMEVRGSDEPRPGPSGGFGVGKVPAHHADSELSACRKSGELDLLERAAAARSRPCRPGEHSSTLDAWTVDVDLNRRLLCSARKSLSPVLDSSSSAVMKRRSPEEMEKELRGEVTTELSLPLKEGRAGEGQSFQCII